MRIWLILSFFIIVLDQITKYWIITILELYESIVIMPLVNFTLVYNYGAAFSFLSDAGGWQRWFFIILASIITLILLIWLFRLSSKQTGIAISLSLIIGGAIGNLIDRIHYGYVIDFIDVYYQSYHWPAFNVADSAISIGAVLLILLSLKAEFNEN